jgi:hypothetical protein
MATQQKKNINLLNTTEEQADLCMTPTTMIRAFISHGPAEMLESRCDIYPLASVELIPNMFSQSNAHWTFGRVSV